MEAEERASLEPGKRFRIRPAETGNAQVWTLSETRGPHLDGRVPRIGHPRDGAYSPLPRWRALEAMRVIRLVKRIIAVSPSTRTK